MRVRIYQPSRNAMQSGVARTKGWVLEFVREDHPSLDPLMGWTTSEDTQSQVRLRFDTRAEWEIVSGLAERLGLDQLVFPDAEVCTDWDGSKDGLEEYCKWVNYKL